MNPKASAYLYAALDQLGVQVRAGVEVVKVLPDAVTSHAGRRRAALPPVVLMDKDGYSVRLTEAFAR
ncbi:hypothetical protein [Streptomyces sp. DASNCL29]|uniref:hypothetical protein n=1 Tax=Streptomyces sp. DASNCL29 TaxID=2583819 RepID=UPI00110F8AF6|nr:hypothetical protein [Streptomyces sp. DASNCL29]TMU96536.1 hypothetical protein FGK60_00445 [Streptomyces sp. DASNCL29]